MGLTVCTNLQKKLLEMIAAWDENDDGKGDDLEAALIHLFFQDGNIFDPPGAPVFVKLTDNRLKNLKETLSSFLPRAEKLGLDSLVKEALKQVESELDYMTPRLKAWKIKLKRFIKSLSAGFVILLIFLSLLSFPSALLFFLACLCTYWFGMWFVKLINLQNEAKFSRILRRISFEEIKVLREWAKNHLEGIGIIENRKNRPKREVNPDWVGNPEIEEVLKRFKDVFENDDRDPRLTEAYEKWWF